MQSKSSRLSFKKNIFDASLEISKNQENQGLIPLLFMLEPIGSGANCILRSVFRLSTLDKVL